MTKSLSRRPLEPLAAVCVLSVMAHAIAAGGVFFLLSRPGLEADSGALVWYAPSDFQMSRTPSVPHLTPTDDTMPAPHSAPPQLDGSAAPTAGETPAAVSAPASPVVPAPPPRVSQKSVSKMIKISLVPPAGSRQDPPRRPVVTLLDVARLSAEEAPGDMDAMLVELQAAFMELWQPPALPSGRPGMVIVRLRLLKDSSVGSLLMQRSSGSRELDASVMEAAGLVKKISFATPANFPEEGYDVEATFQIE